MSKIMLLTALLFAGACGCFQRQTADPPSIPGEFALEAMMAPRAETETAPAMPPEKNWSDGVDVDKIAANPWVIAGVFLLIQWFEIWYFNRTGRKSATIDAAEAAMAPKLGLVQRVLYRLWRWGYFTKNRDKKDPDKEEEDQK